MADVSLEELFSMQANLLNQINASTNQKEVSELLARLTGNMVVIARSVNDKQEEYHNLTIKRLDAVQDFFKADNERISNSLDRIAGTQETLATSEALRKQSEDMRGEFAAIRKQLNALLSQRLA